MSVMDRKRRPDPRLPGRTCLKAGTRLYHGTRCVGDFDVPDGPAWFAFDAEKARTWCDWSSGPPKGREHGDARVLAFVVSRDVEVFDTHAYANWQRLGMALLGDPDPQVEDIVAAVKALGHAGWQGQTETMLCAPEAALVRVPLTMHEHVRVHGVSEEASDLMDDVMEEARRAGGAPFGI